MMTFNKRTAEDRARQELVLATALYLAQNYGDVFPGMGVEDWLVDATILRTKVEKIIDVAYMIDEEGTT